MNIVDAWMPSVGARAGAAAAAAAPGAAGDWRLAVEQAQARAWLRDRNLAPGDARQPALAPEGALAAPGAAAAPRSARPPALAPSRPSAVAGVARRTAPLPPASGQAIQAVIRASAAPVLPALAAAPWLRAMPPAPFLAALAPAAAAASGAVAAGRARRRSVHVQANEREVSVWIRDTSLNRQQARQLAAAIASCLSSGRQTRVAFYLNGRPLADDFALFSSFSSE